MFGLDPVRWLQSIGWKTFEWQESVLRDKSTRICINGARQAGKSTIISARACHMAKYKPGSLTVILAPTQNQSKEDMLKIRAFYSMDQSFPERKKANDQELVLANGSRVLILTASDEAARGFSNPDLIIFDEASRVDQVVFDAVRPMITNNDRAVIVEISTPNGKKGFFYSHFNSDRWSRYEVRCPWDYIATDNLPQLRRTKYNGTPGINFYFSPRHFNENDQMDVILGGINGMGMDSRTYRQEYCCEFVEAQAQVFSNDLIEALFTPRTSAEVPEFMPVGADLIQSIEEGESMSVGFEDFNDFMRRQGY